MVSGTLVMQGKIGGSNVARGGKVYTQKGIGERRKTPWKVRQGDKQKINPGSKRK